MTATLDTMKAAQTSTIDKMHSEVTFTGGFLVGDEVRINLSIQAIAQQA